MLLKHSFFNSDGNCFFWAVDDQCNGEGHLSIRKKVIDRILEMTYLWDYIDGEDVYEWKERMTLSAVSSVSCNTALKAPPGLFE